MSSSEKKTPLRLVVTADGFHSIYQPEIGQHYHSIFGAMQESQRIFMELGLQAAFERFSEVRVFEMGFGTGLNALLTLLEAEKANRFVCYTAAEAYPLSSDEVKRLNFDDLLGSRSLVDLHKAPWGRPIPITPFFRLLKQEGLLQDIALSESYNLVYFDAFAPEAQPELWTQAVFEKLAARMEQGGLLTTYCSKSYVQRNLKAAGFSIEKHAGPARKREVIRAVLQ